MKFKNIKIEINDQQPLNEVVMELERLRYKKRGWIGYSKVCLITTTHDGYFTDHVTNFMDCFFDMKQTTLQQLKEM